MLPGTLAMPSKAAVPTGGIDAYTVLMLHLDGANSGTVFPDSSLKNKTMVRGGTYVTTTGYKKFGTAGGACNQITDCIYVSAATADPDFTFGTGDFTVDFWAYPLSVSVGIMYDHRPNANGLYPCIYLAASNALTYYFNTAAAITGGAVPVNTWSHIALVRASGVTKLYLNGLQTGSSFTDANNYPGAANRPVIHNDGYTVNTYFAGVLDEVRVSKGIARWTTTFTPSTVPYF